MIKRWALFLALLCPSMGYCSPTSISPFILRYTTNTWTLENTFNTKVAIATSTASGSTLTVNGVIESLLGGFKFPDGTTQTTASSGGSVSIGGAVTSGTQGSILFVSTGAVLGQKNSELFWKETTNSLGVGTASPSAKIHVSTGYVPQLIVEDPGNSAGAVADFYVSGSQVGRIYGGIGATPVFGFVGQSSTKPIIGYGTDTAISIATATAFVSIGNTLNNAETLLDVNGGTITVRNGDVYISSTSYGVKFADGTRQTTAATGDAVLSATQTWTGGNTFNSWSVYGGTITLNSTTTANNDFILNSSASDEPSIVWGGNGNDFEMRKSSSTGSGELRTYWGTTEILNLSVSGGGVYTVKVGEIGGSAVLNVGDDTGDALVQGNAYTFQSDTDTGISRSSADVLDVSAGGSRARFTSTGLYVGAATSPSSILQLSGALQLPWSVNSTPMTLSSTDANASLSNSSGTINMPTVVGITGREYQIYKIDTSTQVIVIDPNSTQTINGATTYKLRDPYESIIVSARLASANQTDWNVIGGKPYKYTTTTTDATLTTIATLSVLPSEIHGMNIDCVGIKDNASEAGYFTRKAGYKNNAGTVTEVGASNTFLTDDVAWTISSSVSGTNVIVQVQGNAGDNVSWGCNVSRLVMP